jgi:2-methylisocitrate lyase-like PEP mutase family enzyme
MTTPAPSARLIEAEGPVAVATTSAGIAWSFGVPDGGALDRGWAIDVVRRIVTAVDVPRDGRCRGRVRR